MKAFLDIETGGFSIKKNGVCEIAIVAVDDQLNIVDTFHALIKPYKRENSDQLVSYKDDAMKVNGLTVEGLVKSGKDIIEVLVDLVEFLLKNNITTLVGHNSKVFDVIRIEYLLNRFVKVSIKHLKQEDTIQMAKYKLKLHSFTLENLCKHFGVINKNAHSALDDTIATLEVYKKLI